MSPKMKENPWIKWGMKPEEAAKNWPYRPPAGGYWAPGNPDGCHPHFEDEEEKEVVERIAAAEQDRVLYRHLPRSKNKSTLCLRGQWNSVLSVCHSSQMSGESVFMHQDPDAKDEEQDAEGNEQEQEEEEDMQPPTKKPAGRAGQYHGTDPNMYI